MQGSSNPEGSSSNPLVKGKGSCFQSSPSRLKRFVMFDNSGGNGRVFIHPSLAQELFSPDSQKHKEGGGAAAVTDPLLSNSKNNNPSITCDESAEGESMSRISAYRKMVSSAFSSLQVLRNSRNEDLVFGEHKLLTHNMISGINTNTNDIRSNINSNTNDIRSTVAVNTNMSSNINCNSNFTNTSTTTTTTTAAMTIDVSIETPKCRVSEAVDNIPTTLYHYDRDIHKNSMASETLAFQWNEPEVFATLPSVKKARVSETLGSFTEFFSPFSKDLNQDQNDNGDVIKNRYYHSEDDVKNQIHHQNTDARNCSYNEAESVSTEVWENPDDLDALLSSDSEEEGDNGDDDDDDVRSTGHSPGESSSEKGENDNEIKENEGGYAGKSSHKRERINDGAWKGTNKRGKLSAENQNSDEQEQISEGKEQDKIFDKNNNKEEVVCCGILVTEKENEAMMSDKQDIENNVPSCGQQDHRRQKIKKTMKALRKMIPGGSLLDASLVLDETIQYVKKLCDQVKKLESARFTPQPP